MPSDSASGRVRTTAAELEALYQETILDHYRRPRNKGVLEHPDGTGEVKNPLCGDEIAVHVAYDDDQSTVREAKFAGRGCSISQAAASMMTEIVRGKHRSAIEELAARYDTMLTDGDADHPSLEELKPMSAVARFPARIRCAQLPWEALAKAMRG